MIEKLWDSKRDQANPTQNRRRPEFPQPGLLQHSPQPSSHPEGNLFCHGETLRWSFNVSTHHYDRNILQRPSMGPSVGRIIRDPRAGCLTPIQAMSTTILHHERFRRTSFIVIFSIWWPNGRRYASLRGDALLVSQRGDEFWGEGAFIHGV